MSLLEYRLPDVGEGLQEAEIVTWRVAPGDTVREDDILVEVQTDKSIVEIPAPCDGIVRSLGADEGATLPVGEVLATFEVDGAHLLGDGSSAGQERAASPGSGRRPLASPATRRRAVELGVRLEDVRSTGPSGRVTRADVEQAAGSDDGPEAGERSRPSDQPYTEPASRQDGKVVPLRGLRRQIARTMTATLSIPTIHEWRDIDATELVRVLERMRTHYADLGIRITVLPIVVKAAVLALQQHPNFNARLDLEHEEIIYRNRCNIGFATATPDGLIVPVLRDADRLSVLDIARELKRLAQEARDRRIRHEDTADGTFTVSNYGSFGTRVGAPVIRPPEVAIAGIGQIHDRVVAIDGAPVVRAVLPLCVGTDHRLNDGDHLAAFCRTLERLLAEPMLMLAETR